MVGWEQHVVLEIASHYGGLDGTEGFRPLLKVCIAGKGRGSQLNVIYSAKMYPNYFVCWTQKAVIMWPVLRGSPWLLFCGLWPVLQGSPNVLEADSNHEHTYAVTCTHSTYGPSGRMR